MLGTFKVRPGDIIPRKQLPHAQRTLQRLKQETKEIISDYSKRKSGAATLAANIETGLSIWGEGTELGITLDAPLTTTLLSSEACEYTSLVVRTGLAYGISHSEAFLRVLLAQQRALSRGHGSSETQGSLWKKRRYKLSGRHLNREEASKCALHFRNLQELFDVMLRMFTRLLGEIESKLEEIDKEPKRPNSGGASRALSEAGPLPQEQQMSKPDGVEVPAGLDKSTKEDKELPQGVGARHESGQGLAPSSQTDKLSRVDLATLTKPQETASGGGVSLPAAPAGEGVAAASPSDASKAVAVGRERATTTEPIRTTAAIPEEKSAASGGVQTPAGQRVNDMPVLSKRQYWIIEAMFRLEAVDAAKLRTTPEIATKVERATNADAFKEAIADLRKRGLIETKEGRGGGCWLTAAGSAIAKRLQEQ
ncbi:MAG: hypothetical protein ABSF26_19840 [Thermoguttaceae bacterium]|jgi:hypothetical protein